MEGRDLAGHSPSSGCIVETGLGHRAFVAGPVGVSQSPRLQGSEMEGNSKPQGP